MLLLFGPIDEDRLLDTPDLSADRQCQPVVAAAVSKGLEREHRGDRIEALTAVLRGHVAAEDAVGAAPIPVIVWKHAGAVGLAKLGSKLGLRELDGVLPAGELVLAEDGDVHADRLF